MHEYKINYVSNVVCALLYFPQVELLIFFFSLFQLMSEKKDVKKSPLIETTTTGDNNQSLKPLKR